MKALKPKLLSLAKERLGNSVKNAREDYDNLWLRQQANLTNLTPLLMAEENEAYQRWDYVASLEEKYLKQKSKLHWLLVEDRNNKIFHRTAVTREANICIKEILYQDGIVVVGEKRKNQRERYSDIFCTLFRVILGVLWWRSSRIYYILGARKWSDKCSLLWSWGNK